MKNQAITLFFLLIASFGIKLTASAQISDSCNSFKMLSARYESIHETEKQAYLFLVGPSNQHFSAPDFIKRNLRLDYYQFPTKEDAYLSYEKDIIENIPRNMPLSPYFTLEFKVFEPDFHCSSPDNMVALCYEIKRNLNRYQNDIENDIYYSNLLKTRILEPFLDNTQYQSYKDIMIQQITEYRWATDMACDLL
jgi:hypothetical protein